MLPPLLLADSDCYIINAARYSEIEDVRVIFLQKILIYTANALDSALDRLYNCCITVK